MCVHVHDELTTSHFHLMKMESNGEFHLKSEDIDEPVLEDSPDTDDGFVFTDDSQWNNSIRTKCAPATMKKWKFVVSLFNEWRRQRALRESEVPVPLKDLCDFTPEELNHWLPLFMVEIRRLDGTKYQAKSVLEFLLAIQTWIAVETNVRYSFLKEEQFSPVKNALDTVMRDMQNEGQIMDPQKADLITRRMEDELWSRGILSASSPRLLLRTLVYILGVRLGLRAGEHRMLRRNMFIVDPETQFFTYSAYSSENSSGNLDRKPKTVTVLKGEPGRCPVWYLQEYLAMTESVKSETAFYMRAADVGFTKQVVGQHTLEKMVRDIMDEAGFPGRFTLHSLRMTFTARLHEPEIQETSMAGVTGHSSPLLQIRDSDDQSNVTVYNVQHQNHSGNSSDTIHISLPSIQRAIENQEACAEAPPKKLRFEFGDVKIEFTF